MDPALLEWLLDSDPALRWQVERDLAGAGEHVWRATRARTATEGFGARLLALQDADGQWAGGAYFPAGFDPRAEPDADRDFQREGQPYTATTWSLNQLREWGVDAAALDGTAQRLAEHARWEYEDLPYWGGEVDVCINAFTLANGDWLGADVAALAGWFPQHRLADGGWNCQWVEGATVSSFHSTLNAVRGLLEHEVRTGDRSLAADRRAGEEYLLQRRLLRSLRTGEPLGPWATHLAHPYRWTYSALRALDHFRAAALQDGQPPDPRLAEAIETLRAARGEDGRWVQQLRHPGRVWFEVDVPPGRASKWLTFHALRVLRWWDDRLQPQVEAPRWPQADGECTSSR